MRKSLAFLLTISFAIAGPGRADLNLVSEDFETSSGLTIEGNASYWDIAPLGGTVTYPSPFTQGGGQSGSIFYGVNGYDSTARVTVALPDLSGFRDLELTVSLAAPGGTTWENTHRDSLLFWCDTGSIDSFLPTLRGSPLRSTVWGVDLTPQFFDFRYSLDPAVRSLTFAFASTAGNEVIGIDSLRISGCVVPTPGAALLAAVGLSYATHKLRRKR